MNLSCFECRQQLAAEPASRTPAVVQHVSHCPTCARYQQELERLDQRIQNALAVPVPAGLADRIVFSARRQPVQKARRFLTQRPWLAAAALLLITLGLAGGWWTQRVFTTPLPQALVAHLWHEPQLLTLPAQTRTSAEKVASVLDWGGATISGQLEKKTGKVQHAGLCLFRGRLVAHLVVASETGPVTVLLLPQIQVETPSRFTEQGFSGVLLPRGKGSIAVLSRSSQSSQAVASRYAAMIRWQG